MLDVLARLRPAGELAWREIHWPAALPAELGVAFLRQLGTDQLIRLVAVEVEAREQRLVYRVGVAPPCAARLEQLVESLIPGTAMTTAPARLPLARAWRLRVTSGQRPLRLNAPEAVTRAVLAAITAIRDDERVVLQWLLGPARSPLAVASTEDVPSEASWRAALTGGTKPDPERRRALAEKRGDHGFACVARVGIAANAQGRTKAVAAGVLAGLRTAEAPGMRIELRREESEKLHRVASPLVWPQTLNVKELVGLLGWPLGDQPLPGVPRDEARWLSADPRIRPHRRVLGTATAPGDARLLGLSIDDARHHLHVIGPTGTGKSTLLANLIVQDIAAGRGVVVIDSKGDLVDDVLARIAPNRVGDVVVLDPNETDHVVGLNPLAGRGRRPELVADQLLAVFHGLWKQNWGPRLQDILHASLLTLASHGDASLCVLPALLSDPYLRRRLIVAVDDPIGLEPFWAWFEAISDAERQQAIAPVLNKLRPFLLRKSVRAIVGQLDPRFRIDEVFTKRKVVLVSLAKGVVGQEAAALLGALFVAELWQAILGRAAVSPERRHPVVVYADEFQDYVHLPTDMADALAQARGLGVGLVLAHQHLGQLPGPLRAAVLANARSRVCFQLTPDDAQTLARFSGGMLQPVDFQRLRRFEAYAQLVVGGAVADFASLRTLPLAAQTSEAERIRALSRARYGRLTSDVDAEIRKLLAPNNPSEHPVGVRKRRPQ